MKRLFLTGSVVLFGALATVAQTTATNFTATDCNSVSHTLFNELDAGKVVVLVWIMPCGMCISDAKAAYDAVQSFATSNPGKVLYYLTDDVGDASCSTLNTWAMNNGIFPAQATIFPNAGTSIDESNYGGSAMPHVVVMGGTNHKIYLNLKNGSNDQAVIQTAISSALNTTGVGQTTLVNPAVTIYPNPSTDNINVGISLAQGGLVNLNIFDVRGMKVQSVTEFKPAGSQTINVPLDYTLSNGYYLLRLNAPGTSTVAGFTVSR